MTTPPQTGWSTTRLQMVNACIWAATILLAAVVAKASDEFLYLLLVLLAGSSASGFALAHPIARDDQR